MVEFKEIVNLLFKIDLIVWKFEEMEYNEYEVDSLK